MNDTAPRSPRQFATVYGSPGQRPRVIGLIRVIWPMAPFCFAAGWLFHAAHPYPRISTSHAGFLFVVLAAALALWAAWSARRFRSFLKGAQGEDQVARILSLLPSGFSVLNDLQIPPAGSSVDHVVVAPSGVYVIETKNWSGTLSFEHGRVLCNGEAPDRPPLKQAKTLAADVASFLAETGCPDVPVIPVLCFVGNTLPPNVSNIGGVRVCTDDGLNRLFEHTLEDPLPLGSRQMITTELARCVETADMIKKGGIP